LAFRIGRAIHAIQLSSLWDIPVTDVLLFAPAGFFAVAALAEYGVSYTSTWPIVAIGGIIACTAVEVFHGVASQPIQLGAIVVQLGRDRGCGVGRLGGVAAATNEGA